jgi:parallel beta-helix repeat protein
MKKLLLILMLLFPATSAWATTYYVDNCVVTGNDSNNGTAPATPWLTVAKVTASTFAAGDSILFEKSCTWNEGPLSAHNSGSAGNVITYGSYGTGALPILTGARAITGWSNFSGNVWQATVSAPFQVFFNGTVGVFEAGGTGSVVAANEWYSNAGVVYVYFVGTPTNILGSFFQYGISSNIKSYVTFQNLEIDYFSSAGILVTLSNNVIVTRNNVFHNETGIYLVSTMGTPQSTESVTNNQVAFSGGHGVSVGDYTSNVTISNNNIYSNALDATTFTSGVHICTSVQGIDDNILVEYNTVHDNGGPFSSATAGSGIWADCADTNVVFVYNTSYNNLGVGLYIEITSGAKVYGNLAYNNTSAGIYVSAHTSTAASNNLIYNNTVFGNGAGILIQTDYSAPNLSVGNQIINNISVGNTTYQFGACGSQNDGYYSSGNVYTYNALGAQRTNFLWWNCAYLSTYAALDAAYGSATHSIITDPSLIGNFSLNSGSSCIDAGTNLGSTYQLSLSSASVWPIWPNGVVLANQNSYGSGWDCGAFVYLGSPQTPGFGSVLR